MKFFLIIILSFITLIFQATYAQVENVQIEHGVYTFLKEMKVKGIIPFIREDDPVLSRFEVKDMLEKINGRISELSSTEKKY